MLVSNKRKSNTFAPRLYLRAGARANSDLVQLLNRLFFLQVRETCLCLHGHTVSLGLVGHDKPLTWFLVLDQQSVGANLELYSSLANHYYQE